MSNAWDTVVTRDAQVTCKDFYYGLHCSFYKLQHTELISKRHVYMDYEMQKE